MEQSIVNKVAGSGAVITNSTVELQAENIAGRDLIIENNTIYERNSFRSVNTSSYGEERYIAPVFVDEILDKVLRSHFLIIHGGPNFDKEQLVRHLAYQISKHKLIYETLEWEPSEEIRRADFLIRLSETGKETIFLLSKASPKDLNFEPDRVRKKAEESKQFVIVTTNLSASHWNLSEQFMSKYFYVIPDKNIYSSVVLSQTLCKELSANKGGFQLENEPEVFGFDSRICNKYSVTLVAEQLENPEQIDLFVGRLCTEENIIDNDILDRILLELKDTRKSLVEKWFLGLGEKEKFIALGACLLEGVYEDQFFRVFQEVIIEFWRFREPTLRSLDYDDLVFMEDFYSFTSYRSKTLLTAKYPNQRTDILKAAWRSYRRHLMAAIPVFSRVANNSRMVKFRSDAIYNSIDRRKTIRIVVAEMFSDIGLHSLPMVEESILRFAMVRDESLKRISAKALSRWREMGKDEQLFELLNKWLSDYWLIDFVIDLANNEGVGNLEEHQAKTDIKNAILFTLAYAMEYDGPNNLHQGIIDIVMRLAVEENPAMRVWINPIFEKIITRHFLQLKELIVSDLMVLESHQDAISEGLYLACYAYKPEVIKMLEEVMNFCLQRDNANASAEAQYKRDKLMLCVFAVYKKICFRPGENQRNERETLWQWLVVLYKYECSLEMKKVILDLVGELTAFDADQALPFLERVFEYAEMKERQYIFSGLSSVYILQRKALTGATYQVDVDGVLYPAYPYSARPLTPIEAKLFDWINQGSQFAKQFAILTFLQFAKVFDSIESKRVPEPIDIKQSPARDSLTKGYREGILPQGLSPVFLPESELSILTRLVLWFWLLFEADKDKIMIRGIIKSLLQHDQIITRGQIDTVIRRFLSRQDGIGRKLARWLERFCGRIF